MFTSAIALSTAIKNGETTAKATIEATLKRIEDSNSQLNCFTTILAARAMAQAETVDRAIALGNDPGILAGVPFAVKNLFDIQGLVTVAGSKIERDNAPATAAAPAIARLQQAGAILVGATNMDEYAYGFVTENSHYGATKNPHDPTRIAGGSSGGSAAAVAAKLVPFSLGSDTNGSIRVPAALCGVYGLRPTYGRLSRRGAKLFAGSLDCIGPFANSIEDIAAIFDLLQGEDPLDPVCTSKPPQLCFPELNLGIENLRIAIANDYFSQGATQSAIAVVETIAKALNVTKPIIIPESHRARAAAYIITAVEGANLHLKNLQSRPQDFAPATRDRFLAGALIPSSWYIQAQRFRSWYCRQLQAIFQEVDVILTPTTPWAATLLGQEQITISGSEIPIRPNLGRFTQPLSLIGLPAISIPVTQSQQLRTTQDPTLQGENASLPLGIQIVAAPHRESVILRVAKAINSLKI
ncbi:MAG: AtzE family amidohydrolase [Pleurocapsa sp.]